MPKLNPLSQGLNKQARPPEPPAVPVADAVTPAPVAQARPPSKARAGRVLIGGHFSPEVQTELKILAAQERTTLQALVAEGINAVLARRHKPQIAELLPQDSGSA